MTATISLERAITWGEGKDKTRIHYARGSHDPSLLYVWVVERCPGQGKVDDLLERLLVFSRTHVQIDYECVNKDWPLESETAFEIDGYRFATAFEEAIYDDHMMSTGALT